MWESVDHLGNNGANAKEIKHADLTEFNFNCGESGLHTLAMIFIAIFLGEPTIRSMLCLI